MSLLGVAETHLSDFEEPPVHPKGCWSGCNRVEGQRRGGRGAKLDTPCPEQPRADPSSCTGRVPFPPRFCAAVTSSAHCLLLLRHASDESFDSEYEKEGRVAPGRTQTFATPEESADAATAGKLTPAHEEAPPGDKHGRNKAAPYRSRPRSAPLGRQQPAESRPTKPGGER
ncbi:hypothetical protein HPB47_012440 [Ixodes persulcatus]|uniref:Uncharacterized protein n=1 Tax=Ixodes persulcatus TaxID=34615 RepID=A0AC60NTI9_IXOPE|nr:hypothetical protein HPB47_012440 [Ixodes persulcatus]